MNSEQQLFSLLYAVLFAAMLSSLSQLAAFPWGFPAVEKVKRRLFWRLAFSVTAFNILPFLIFAFGLQILAGVQDQTGFWGVFLIGLASLSVYAPYRFYHFFMVVMKERCCRLYEAGDYSKVIKRRGIRESGWGHFLALSFYSLLFFLLLAV